MREVYVAGIGITSFTRLEFPLVEIAAYPGLMAMKESGIKSIDQLYVANMGASRANHQTGLASAVIDNMSLTPAGAETIENGPASGASAIKQGFMAIASGMYDTVMVIGAERMREVNTLEATDFVATLTHPMAEYIYGVTLPALAGMFARLYMEKYGVTSRHLAMVAVKNHKHAMDNFYAHLHEEITIEELARLVKEKTSNKQPLRYIPYEEAYAAGFEDMHRRVPCLEKLVRLTGYRPSTPLSQIVDLVVLHAQEGRELMASSRGTGAASGAAES